MNLETVAIMTGVVGFFHPWIMDFVNGLWLDSIVNEKVRKSSIFLFGATFGFAITFIINATGSYGLSPFDCFIVGSGLYTTVGEGMYRLRKFKKNGDNGENGTGV